jgi:hypothetical protein
VTDGHRGDDLYIMDVRTILPATARLAQVDNFPDEDDELLERNEAVVAAHALAAKADLDTWQCRLGQLHVGAVTRMVRKNMVKGMVITPGNSPPTPCEPCLKGKQTLAEIKKSTETRAEVILERVHSDICGKLSTRSHQGYEYFVTWMDDKSRKVFVAGLRKKDDTLEHLRAFVTLTHSAFGPTTIMPGPTSREM